MSTLTADQTEYIRAMSGDDCTPYDVSDTLLQKLFGDRAGDDECRTIVYVLRIRDAKWSMLVNQSNESGQSQSLSQKHAQIRNLRQEWEERCGMAGGSVDVGTFDLHIDTDCEDLLNSDTSWLW